MSLDFRNLRICEFRELPGWDDFVEDHPKGTILYTTRMIHCELHTKLHHPFAYAAVDEDGQICAMLVAVRVATVAALPGPLNSRSIMYAEPIWLDSPSGLDGLRKLIEYHDQFMKTRTLFAEIRPNFSTPTDPDPLVEMGYRHLGYLNYELALQNSEDHLFQKVGPKVRNNVRSAIRHGVSIREVELSQHVDEVYQLLQQSYANSSTPMVDKTQFRAAGKLFAAKNLRVFIADYQGVPVAAGCFLNFKGRVTCWFAGTLRLPGVPAMTLIFWEAMRQYAQDGCQLFDFAGAGWQGEDYGPGRFKKKFRGTLTNYGRYRKVYAPWMMRAAERVYQNVRVYISPKPSQTARLPLDLQ